MSKLVYFMKPIGAPGPIKIGCSNAPERRLNQLSIWSPIPLEIIATAPGTHQIENRLHNRFAAAHSHSEWFHPVPDLIEMIAKIAAGSSVEAAIDLDGCTDAPRSLKARPKSERMRRSMSLGMRLKKAVQSSARQARTALVIPRRAIELAHSVRHRDLEPADAEYLEAVIRDPLAHCERASFLPALHFGPAQESAA